jgi:putative membrane protein
MTYKGYQFWGMDMIWWFLWIFVNPNNIPGQRSAKDSSLNLLKKRFVSGEINKEEYEKYKLILVKD